MSKKKSWSRAFSAHKHPSKTKLIVKSYLFQATQFYYCGLINDTAFILSVIKKLTAVVMHWPDLEHSHVMLIF